MEQLSEQANLTLIYQMKKPYLVSQESRYDKLQREDNIITQQILIFYNVLTITSFGKCTVILQACS